MFDLDGTLLDTLQDLADSMNRTLDAMGHSSHDVDDYRYFVGDGVAALARRVLPENHRDDETVNHAVEGMRKEYSKRWAEKTKPYDGVAEMLDGLAKLEIPMAVLSNKPDDFTKLMVAELLGHWQFQYVFGVCDAIPAKPDPGGALGIAAKMDIEPRHILYLGDTNTDMKTANAAGMYAVGALWGFRTAEELNENGAKEIIEHPTDLLKFF